MNISSVRFHRVDRVAPVAMFVVVVVWGTYDAVARADVDFPTARVVKVAQTIIKHILSHVLKFEGMLYRGTFAFLYV